MENDGKRPAVDFDGLNFHLEAVYGDAGWALRYGATKECLLHAIEQALKDHQDCLSEEGWLIKDEMEAPK